MSSRSHYHPSHCGVLALLGLQEHIDHYKFKSLPLKLSNSWNSVVPSSRLETGCHRREAAA